HPGAVALDSNGHLWVADTGNHRIEEFTEKGQFLKAFGSYGRGDGQLVEPSCVEIDSHGNGWVCDGRGGEKEGGRIEEFTEGGEFVRKIGQEALMSGSSYPSG